tara:strand:+ start:3178 stop:4029 length:852 start_codon:yes stop_codon:yes gene_type:complete
VIAQGAGLGEIATVLETEGKIKYKSIFIFAAQLLGKARQLMAGEYLVKAEASPRDILTLLISGQTVVRKVTFPEGLTSAQIVNRLKLMQDLTGDIQTVPSEGSLLPETYNYHFGETRTVIIERMQAAMAGVLRKSWPQRSKGLPYNSTMEAVILASIIEKETGLMEERRLVASVFINRLRLNMRLQSDPTVSYGIFGSGRTRPLTRRDLFTKTPYNTYKINGLPPTPICNPGKASIMAALRPGETDFLYFVASGAGGHAFAKNLAEHNRNVSNWRKIKSRSKN